MWKRRFYFDAMHSEVTKILEFNQYVKLDKTRLIIYADLWRIVEMIDGCEKNPKNSSTRKVSEYIRSSFSLSTISSVKSIERNNDVYRGKDCMKMLYESLREHAVEILKFEKEKQWNY